MLLQRPHQSDTHGSSQVRLFNLSFLADGKRISQAQVTHSNVPLAKVARAPPHPQSLSQPFVARILELLLPGWQVRVHTWPSPSVSDLRVLHLSATAVSALGFLSQSRFLTRAAALQH